MESHSTKGNLSLPRKVLFGVIVIAWTSAAWASQMVGIWPAIGFVALVFGALTIHFDLEACQKLFRPSWNGVVLGLAVGAVMAVATHLMYPVMANLIPQVKVETAHLYAAFRTPSMWIATLCLIPVILGEELVWRGLVQTELGRRFGTVQGVVLAAGLYTLVQVPLGSLVLLLAAFTCGLIWGVLRAGTHSLVAVVVAHILWDLVILLWVPLDMG